MSPRFEEEPYEIPDDPDEEPDEDPADPAAVAGAQPVPAVASARGEREYEYRVETLTLDEVLDGHTLPDKLSQASSEDWQLVDILDAGERKVIVLRKRRDSKPQRRPVGFAPGR